MKEWREEIHGAVCDVKSTARPIRGRRKIGVELSVHVELVLGKPSEMGAEDAGFVRRGARSIVADCGVLAQRDTNTNNLWWDE